MSDGPVNRVSVTDLDMPFPSMVRFMVKWAVASIPALLILAILGAVFWGVLLGFFAGLGSSLSRKPSERSSTSSSGSAPSSPTADPVNRDAQYQWAKTHEAKATERAPSFDDIKNVLALVPKVLDPDKDSGAEEADPYLLALATLLRTKGLDARIVTQETKDTPKKMSLNTACGLLGIPSVPLAAFLQFERILT
jgi:Domain of unknown function (DUF4411)